MDDPYLDELLQRESRFYLQTIDLIAASNAPHREVRANDKWSAAQFRAAEGHAGRRPYAGTGYFDEIERLAVDRACAIFRAEHANVQAHSGSLANLAAYKAVLRPGDKLLAMSTEAGGHLSHSHSGHIVQDLYQVVTYGVSADTALIDYDRVRHLALQERPGAIIAGFTCYPRTVDFWSLAEIAAEARAVLIADISHISGLVIAGLHPNPCDCGALVTSSVGKTLRGTRGGLILSPAGLAGDVDAAVFPGIQSSVGLAGLVSTARLLFQAGSAEFYRYQNRVVSNARLLARKLLAAGIPLLTGGTDTHMLVVDCRPLKRSGAEAERRLESIGILSNRTTLPINGAANGAAGEDANGLRLGTAAITARGFDDPDVSEMADILVEALTTPDSWEGRPQLRDRVLELATAQRESDTLADLLPQEAPQPAQRRKVPRVDPPSRTGSHQLEQSAESSLAELQALGEN